MFVERLQRDLAVCGAAEIEPFLDGDPGRWHVVSIREPSHPEPVLVSAKRSHAMVFKDVFAEAGADGPRPAHLEAILRFVERSGREPLVIHCWAGRSRSAAVALVVIVKELWDAGMDGAELVREAVTILLQVRAIAAPNRLVLRLGLQHFLPAGLAKTLAENLMREPRIQRET